MAYLIIEHNAKNDIKKGRFNNAQSVCDYLNKEYKIFTYRVDLLSAIKRYNGKAWLYPFWGSIEIKRV